MPGGARWGNRARPLVPILRDNTRAGCNALRRRRHITTATGYRLPAAGGKAEKMPLRYAGSVRAPEFPAGLEWFNSEPLTVPRLRGKVVILDFWTYC
jgi:hypothetical protein